MRETPPCSSGQSVESRFKKWLVPGFVFITSIAAFISPASGSIGADLERPNILWITSEDNHISFLRLYDPAGAAMPRLESLADQGVVFGSAYCHSPVCSTARSTLFSGVYGPRAGSQFHRRFEYVPLPDGLRLFPHYLKEAGYYTSNNVKKDYNFEDLSPWHESSNRATWKNRQPGQPFFHVQNHTATHEHKLHFEKDAMHDVSTRTDPSTASLWPQHPDTPLMRYTYARYLDQHLLLDQEIGRLVDELDKDGLLDNTILFYFGDNGGVLPGSKGYLREHGLNVPLLVWFPEKWKHLSPMATGSRWQGFVRFVDFAPTVLNLAGIPVPDAMDGKAFLGPGVKLQDLKKRDEAIGYADRFDEKHDFSRSIRKGKWKYIRNYQPWIPDALEHNYRYKMQAFREWRELYHAGALNPVQARFFRPKAVEELYDLESDPHETRNLALTQSHADELLRMRTLLQQRLVAMPDLSFVPEPMLIWEAFDNPTEYGRKNQTRISTYVHLLASVHLSAQSAVETIQDALQDSDPLMRFWAITAAITLGRMNEAVENSIRACAQEDANRLVRVRAAEYLTVINQQDCSAVFQEVLAQVESALEASYVLNQVAVLMDHYEMPPLRIDSDQFPESWQKEPVLAPRLAYLEARVSKNK